MSGLLITLTEDGPLGKAGSRVWVDGPDEKAPEEQPKAAAARKAPVKKQQPAK